MFGWRRRSEGFEWREYVRTTVLVRRADRQRRVEDARMAAHAKVKEQKDRGVEAGKAGLNAAGSAAGKAAVVAGQGARAAARLSGTAIAAVFSGFLARAGALLRNVPMPAITRNLPRLPRTLRIRDLVPDIAGRGPISRKHLAYAGGAAGAIFVIGPMLNGAMPTVPSGLTTGSIKTAERVAVASHSSEGVSANSSGGINGRATAISGHVLRVGSDVVRLAGIEAPEATQPCFKANGRKWTCSASATNALNRLVRGKRVSCDVSGIDDAGRKLGTCRAGDSDIAAELVRGGHVFAESG
jgi:endonuclease YncB( thermonuclease family)